MSTFRTIIDKWPSKVSFASDIGATAQSVWNMHDRDSIPARYWAAIVEGAERRDIDNVSLEIMAAAADGRQVVA